MVITTRVLTAAAAGGAAIYSNAWLLFQLPYGVIGVSLLTAIMPRMSRAAADGDTGKLIERPVAGQQAVHGHAGADQRDAHDRRLRHRYRAVRRTATPSVADAERLGAALAFSAFGILPYALVMLQMRVFYAMKDARTPTLIMIVMTVGEDPAAVPGARTGCGRRTWSSA